LAGDSLRKAKKSQTLAATASGSAQAPLCDDNPENRRSPAG